MKENRPAPKKRKMPLKQRAAIAVVRFAERHEQQKTQRTPSAGRTGQRSAPAQKAAGQSPRTGQAPRRPSGQQPSRAGQTGQGRQRLTPQQRAAREAHRRRQLRLRRRRKAMRITIAVFAALIVLLILSRTVFFKIEDINVTNAKSANYTLEQIVAQSGIVYGTQNLFSCDLDKVAKNIEQRLPYIGKAQVERDFPKSLRVTVTPTKAAAAIALDAGYLLIDAQGKMLETVDVAPDGIPVLRCNTEFDLNLGQYIGVSVSKKPDDRTKASAEMIGLFQDVYSAIKDAKLDDITLIDIRDDRAITLMYQNRLTLHLGDANSLDAKLNTGAKVIAVENDASGSRIGAIDLTTAGRAHSRDMYASSGEEETTEAESTTEAQES